MAVQEVIIYRSPLEYQLYESNLLFPILSAAIVAFVVALVATNIIRFLFGHSYNPHFRSYGRRSQMWGHFYNYGGLYVAAIAAVLTFKGFAS